MFLKRLFAGFSSNRSAAIARRSPPVVPPHPLPRDLAEAPDWLLDDLGQLHGPRPTLAAGGFSPWTLLVRRLG